MWSCPQLLIAIVLLLVPASFIAQAENQDRDDHPSQTRRFDGKWQTTVSCDPSRGALGFSYRFMSEIKDGSFHGLRGAQGQPSSLLITGTIGDDGSARLYAEGLTGSKEFVPGTDTPRGTTFGYHIRAHFDQRHGDGARVEGRPCTLQFEKQSP